MNGEKFISIGTKGTCLARDLMSLEPGLRIGENRLRWAGRGSSPVALKAVAWVSKNGEPFDLYPLAQAIRENRVIHVPRIVWVTSGGKRYEGEAFFPPAWKPGNDQPQLVAVRSATWSHGCVDRKSDPNGRNSGRVARFSLPSLDHPTPRRPWTDKELQIVLNVYHKLSFGQFHARQPVIIEVAQRLGRTPDSVAMKLGNFASLDPALHLRGIKGLAGASGRDKEMWERFHANLETEAEASEEAIRRLFEVPENTEFEIVKGVGVVLQARPPTPPAGETEVEATVRTRRGQQFFRNVVLNNFDRKCGVTGLGISSLLVASHILPWRAYPAERLLVENGLCLSRLHDAAFDQGLITFDDELRLVIGSELRKCLSREGIDSFFAAYEGSRLKLGPDAKLPRADFLAVHKRDIYRK